MSKNEFWILNIVGGACAVLMVIVLILGYMNEGLNQSAVAGQNLFNQAQQFRNTAESLLTRVIQTSHTEPALVDLLGRYGFQSGTNRPAAPAASR